MNMNHLINLRLEGFRQQDIALGQDTISDTQDQVSEETNIPPEFSFLPVHSKVAVVVTEARHLCPSVGRAVGRRHTSVEPEPHNTIHTYTRPPLLSRRHTRTIDCFFFTSPVVVTLASLMLRAPARPRVESPSPVPPCVEPRDQPPLYF